LNGTLDLHQQLEAELAQFSVRSVPVFFDCYQANLASCPDW